jgi:hypothetical protein
MRRAFTMYFKVVRKESYGTRSLAETRDLSRRGKMSGAIVTETRDAASTDQAAGRVIGQHHRMCGIDDGVA